jgi:hypothetical protein
VQDQVLDGDELAVEKEACAGVRKVGPADKTVADRAFVEALVEPSKGILGFGQRSLDGRRQRLVQDFLERAHARSAATSILTPGRSAGANVPEVSRSRTA